MFLPTRRAGREVEQAPIRLKNLLRQATDALNSDGVRAPKIGRLLAPLRRLLDDRLFWQYQSDGLALFSRPGWWWSFRVPLDLPELAVVADRFQVSLLLPLLAGDGHGHRPGRRGRPYRDPVHLPAPGRPERRGG